MMFEDERTEQEKAATTGFIVCYSGFGNTHVIRPIKEDGEVDVIMDVMRKRDDLKRVRYARGKETKEGLTYRPRLQEGQRAYIHNFNSFLPHAGHCAHVGARVSYYPMRGNIEHATELAHGVTDVVTSTARGLLLGEWRVSELLPIQDLHGRDEQWQAWVMGDDNIREALDFFGIGTSENNHADMVAMMKSYQGRDVDFFTGDEILDVDIISGLDKDVRGVILTLTS